MLHQALKKAAPKSSRYPDGGFTLFELLIVVVIISIIAAIAAPGWGALANRQKAKRATDQLRQAIRQTQAEARRTRRNRALQFDTELNLLDYPGDGAAGSVSLTEGDVDAESFEFVVVNEDGNAIPAIDRDENGLSEIWFSANGGLDVDRNNSVDLPIYLSVTPQESGATRCIIIRSLIGGIEFERNDNCVTGGGA